MKAFLQLTAGLWSCARGLIGKEHKMAFDQAAFYECWVPDDESPPAFHVECLLNILETTITYFRNGL